MKFDSRRQMRILLIVDDRPGHFQLSEGIVAALDRIVPTEVRRLQVKRRALFANRMLARAVARRLPAARLLKLAYGVEADTLPASDLIVSAGGNTLAANILAARLLGAKNVFYGSLRQYSAEDFTLCFTSYDHQVTGPNIISLLKPSRLDPNDFPLPQGDASRLHTVGLLLGGDGSGFTFVEQDWSDLIDFCNLMHNSFGTRFIVANSRRTPEAVSCRLVQEAASRQDILEFIDVRTAGPGTLKPLFARSQAILVGADSSSMISEAIWLRRPTLAVRPRTGALEQAEQIYRSQLMVQGLLAEMSVADMTPEGVASRLSNLTPLSSNPLEMLAAILREHLPCLSVDDDEQAH